MMEQYAGYWIYGSAVPGPPNTNYWESEGTVFKSGRQGSVIQVTRLCDSGIRFEIGGLAEWYALELCRIAVDECLTVQY
jgi:hypothetical protein